MFSIEACIEKHYLKILIFLFVLGWLYLYFLNQREERIKNGIKDAISCSWLPF